MSAEAEQARAAILGRTQARVPLSAAKKNMRDAGQGFGVIDDRRPAPESDDGRKRWADARNATLALE